MEEACENWEKHDREIKLTNRKTEILSISMI